MPDSCPMAHLINNQTPNISPHDYNRNTVKHCSYASAKTPYLNSKRTTQVFKPGVGRQLVLAGQNQGFQNLRGPQF